MAPPPRLLPAAVFCLFWLAAFCGHPAFGQARMLKMLGWNDYIDPTVILEFTEETGITVTYDSYGSDAALEQRLGAGKESFDVVIVSAPLLSKTIATGAWRALDEASLPNRKHLWPEITSLLSAYDLGNRFAVTYMWFTLGLSYNVGKVESVVAAAPRRAARPPKSPPMDSWRLLFERDHLLKFSNCGVGVVDNPEYLLAIARRYLWSDWKSAAGLSHETDLARAGDMLGVVLRDAKRLSPAAYVAALANGEICLAVGSSLDSLRARDQAREVNNGVDIAYAIPREGAPVLIDALAIPKNAPHVADAHRFIDFLLRPEIAARNSNFTQAANGVLASKPLVNRSIAGNRAIYPEAGLVERLFVPEKTRAPSRDAFLREWPRMK